MHTYTHTTHTYTHGENVCCGELASSIASKCMITRHINSAMFTYSNIAKVYFDSVEELPDGEGAIWQCARNALLGKVA